MIIRTLFAVVLGLAALAVDAADGFITKRKLQPRHIAALTELIQQEMTAPGGRFVHVSDEERARVDADLAEMQRILEGKDSTDALDADEQVALINAQERVNTILTRRDRDRLICSRSAKVGSHMRQTTCETYGEQMARKAAGGERARMLSQPRTCHEAAPGGDIAFCAQESHFVQPPGN